MKNEINLKNVELSISEKELDEFFNNFKNTCRKFTYQLRPDEKRLAEKYQIPHFRLNFNSPEELIHSNSVADLKNIDLSLKLNSKTTFPEASSQLKNIKYGTLRLYLNVPGEVNGSENDNIFRFFSDFFSSELKNNDISFCIQNKRVIDQIELSGRLVKKFPELSSRMHIEPPDELSPVENSLLISILHSIFCLRASSFAARLKNKDASTTRFTLELLRSLGYANIPGVFLIACPTCARTRINVIALAHSIYEKIQGIEKTMSVAVMGCEVNGPGEASHADLGVAGGLGRGILFEKGKITEQVPADKIEVSVIESINRYLMSPVPGATTSVQLALSGQPSPADATIRPAGIMEASTPRISLANRRPARRLKIGNIVIGGGEKIAIQSMSNLPTTDVAAVIDQTNRLADAGCDIMRVGVLNEDAARCLGKIKKGINIPLVADIHFDHRLALIAIDEGIDKLRLNPGNIKKREYIEMVVAKAKAAHIPIRIGVNSGSVPKDALMRHGGVVTPDALVEAAMWEIKILEELGFFDIAISLKSSSPAETIAAYQKISRQCDYPLHLGITEAGIRETGEIRSAAGIGYLLYEGIGDTFRVSLTEDPLLEIVTALEIKNALRVK
ncbi:MAG TPA: flavodoxin-dependent (E)-4-hydroxy-3-methylbut-2-enyl-diphosphate synthase [Candidatus Wallbacteria bacterium]|nr:flavodoxin-dependent (E)-4-hydroxy-3-methylbut-2-enyl-diphosphate synthase [Candidatus Wallbacteria bacterium]